MKLQISRCPNCKARLRVSLKDPEYKYLVIHNQPGCPFGFEVAQDLPREVNRFISWVFTRKRPRI